MSEDEYNRLLKELPKKLITALDSHKFIERFIQVGRKTGRTDLQIGDDARAEMGGLIPDRTLRSYLPLSMKHGEKIRLRPEFAADLPQNKGPEPKIPPLPEIRREVESDPEPEPQPQAQAQPIPKDPVLDCNKFRSELRTGLLNNSKLHLKINSLNEVVAIE